MIAQLLRHQFIFRPFKLRSVIKPLEGLPDAGHLYKLAGEYLPEERDRIFRHKPVDAAAEFIKLFSERYFPIDRPERGGSEYIDGRWHYQDLVEKIVKGFHVTFCGMREHDYEPATWNRLPDGQFLAEIICVCPFNAPKLKQQVCSRGMMSTPTGTRDDRQAVLAEFKIQFKEEAAALLKLMPAKGWALEDIAKALTGSPYENLIARCRWISASSHPTGCRWVDLTRYDANQYKWNKGLVTRIAREWAEYCEMERRMHALESWLGHHRNERFTEIIRYLAEKINGGKHGSEKTGR